MGNASNPKNERDSATALDQVDSESSARAMLVGGPRIMATTADFELAHTKSGGIGSSGPNRNGTTPNPKTHPLPPPLKVINGKSDIAKKDYKLPFSSSNPGGTTSGMGGWTDPESYAYLYKGKTICSPATNCTTSVFSEIVTEPDPDPSSNPYGFTGSSPYVLAPTEPSSDASPDPDSSPAPDSVSGPQSGLANESFAWDGNCDLYAGPPVPQAPPPAPVPPQAQVPISAPVPSPSPGAIVPFAPPQASPPVPPVPPIPAPQTVVQLPNIDGYVIKAWDSTHTVVGNVFVPLKKSDDPSCHNNTTSYRVDFKDVIPANIIGNFQGWLEVAQRDTAGEQSQSAWLLIGTPANPTVTPSGP